MVWFNICILENDYGIDYILRKWVLLVEYIIREVGNKIIMLTVILE